MAQSIHFHGGVLQNLVVVPELDDEGRWSGKLGAVAGETRRLALCLMRASYRRFDRPALRPGLRAAALARSRGRPAVL